jgi:hypothetical protein
MKLTRLGLLSSLAPLINGYIWPSPKLDALEHLRWDQDGVNAGGLQGFVASCDIFSFAPNLDFFTSGRSNLADWIRTVSLFSFFLFCDRIQQAHPQAYHDMATYNVAEGTGGLDGSIRFAEEQARPEVSFLTPATVSSVLKNVSSSHPRTLDQASITRYKCWTCSLTATYPVSCFSTAPR